MPKYTPEQDQIFDHLDATGIFDAATIRELAGVEADPDDLEPAIETIASGAGDVAISGFADGAPNDGHDEWIAKLHLTHPSDVYPEIPRRTPEQRARTTQSADVVRENIAPGPNTPRG